MHFDKHFPLQLALGGGVASLLGEPLLHFLVALIVNPNALVFKYPDFVYFFFIPDPKWYALCFMTGFVMIGLFAPSFIRKLSMPSDGKTGWPKIGLTYGALCGFFTCLALEFLNLAIYPRTWIYGIYGSSGSYDGRVIEGLVRVISFHYDNGAVIYVPFALLIGAGLGAMVETYMRLGSPENPPVGSN